jgi:hypothetical protein
MRCILHIGTEKTGSTSIQEYLYSSRETLRKSGIHVCTSLGEGNNRALPAAFMSLDKTDDYIRSKKLEANDKRTSWKSKLLKSLKKEIMRAQDSADVFLISSEHFQSRLTTPEEVGDLHAFLSPLFEEIRVICYLRRQDQMALSRYSEALRAGFMPSSPLPMGVLKKIQRVPHFFDFELLLKRWSACFGAKNINPRLYSSVDLGNGGIINDFLLAIGITSLQVNRSKRSNISLSAEAQTVLLSVNEKLKGDDWSRAKAIRGPLVTYLEQHSTGASRLPTMAQAKSFYSTFEPSNHAVARQWFGRDELFDTDFSVYPKAEPGVDARAVAELMAGFFLNFYK